MDSKCYAGCEDALKSAAAENAKNEPNQIKGHVWCAISEDEKVEPELVGPFRYKVSQGMMLYKKIVYSRLTKENQEKANSFIADGVDFIAFIHADHQCVTLFNTE